METQNTYVNHPPAAVDKDTPYKLARVRPLTQRLAYTHLVSELTGAAQPPSLTQTEQ